MNWIGCDVRQGTYCPERGNISTQVRVVGGFNGPYPTVLCASQQVLMVPTRQFYELYLAVTCLSSSEGRQISLPLLANNYYLYYLLPGGPSLKIFT